MSLSTRPSHHEKGILLMLGASLCFAIMAAGAKWLSASLSPVQIVWTRSLVATLLLVPFLGRRRRLWIGQEPAWLALRGIVGFTAMMLYFWCLSRLDLGTAVILNYTAPIFAVLLSAVFAHERPAGWTRLAIGGAFVGVYLLAAPQFHSQSLALWAGLLSGLLAGTVHLMIRRSHDDEDPLTIIFYFSAISAVGSGLMLFWSPLRMPTIQEALWLGIVSIVSLAGQAGFTYSLKSSPVPVVSPFGYISPVFSILIGWLLWQETLTPSGWLGSTLIVVCGILMYRAHAAD